MSMIAEMLRLTRTHINAHALQVCVHRLVFACMLVFIFNSLSYPLIPSLLFTPPSYYFSLLFFLLSFFIFVLQGMPLPFPFVDNYADLESEALLVLEPAKKSIARNSKNEELTVMNNENDNILNLNIIQTVQSVLQNPLSSLSEFNWRGERILEQLEKHKVSISSIFAVHNFFYFSSSSFLSLLQFRYWTYYYDRIKVTPLSFSYLHLISLQ
jgi:hypothetical protein